MPCHLILHIARNPRRPIPDHASHSIAASADTTLSWQRFSRTLVLGLALLAGACSPQAATARAAPGQPGAAGQEGAAGGGQYRGDGNRLRRRSAQRTAAGAARHAARPRIPPPLRQPAPAGRRRRVGLHRRSVRHHRHQQPRGRSRRQDRRFADRRPPVARQGHRPRRTDRRRRDQGRKQGGAAQRVLGRLPQGRSRRLDPRRRQSVRPGRVGFGRHHLRRGTRPRLRPVRQFPAA